MDAYAAFYEVKLYPLQDGILSTVARSRSRFYLTGGTAIGRAWLGHRYSDDLDFFLSRDPDYPSEVALLLALVEGSAGALGYTVLRDRSGRSREKELGLDAPQAADVLRSFPARLFDAIEWRQRPDPGAFASELERISLDILAGGENSLAPPHSTAL